jgi:hypothetical protein
LGNFDTNCYDKNKLSPNDIKGTSNSNQNPKSIMRSSVDKKIFTDKKEGTSKCCQNGIKVICGVKVCRVARIGNSNSYIVNARRDLLLKEIFQVQDGSVIFMFNGKVLESKDLIFKGIHRIVISGRLKGGNPRFVRQVNDETFYCKVEQYLKRRRGKEMNIETDLLVSEDVTLFENLF